MNWNDEFDGNKIKDDKCCFHSTIRAKSVQKTENLENVRIDNDKLVLENHRINNSTFGLSIALIYRSQPMAR